MSAIVAHIYNIAICFANLVYHWNPKSVHCSGKILGLVIFGGRKCVTEVYTMPLLLSVVSPKEALKSE